MAGNIMQRLASAPASRGKLRKRDFDLTNGTAGERTLLAEHKAQTPTFVRPSRGARLAFATIEEFQAPGDGSQTTYDLSYDLIETPNTDNIVLFEAGNVVQPDSVDYAADTFTYTGPGSAEYLHAAYVPRDGALVEIERQAPRAQGGVTDVILDEPTSLLHPQDQNQEPPEFHGMHPLDYAVPKNWKVQIYANGPVPFEWDDSSESNPQGATARNAVVSIPVRRAQSDVQGLSRAVKRHIIDDER